MIFYNGTFYAFFNAGVYCATTYRIVYATSSSILSGPYEFGGTLLETGTYQGVELVSPGGIGFAFVAQDVILICNDEGRRKS